MHNITVSIRGQYGSIYLVENWMNEKKELAMKLFFRDKSRDVDVIWEASIAQHLTVKIAIL